MSRQFVNRHRMLQWRQWDSLFFAIRMKTKGEQKNYVIYLVLQFIAFIELSQYKNAVNELWRAFLMEFTGILDAKLAQFWFNTWKSLN